MKFKTFKKFTGDAIEDVLEFVQRNVNQAFDELSGGLTKLEFVDNFNCYKTVVTIPATTEVPIGHPFNQTPSYRIIVRQSGNAIITDGVNEWTDQVIYLKNNSATQATITLLIFK